MSDQQSYRTTGHPTDGNSEWNRMNAAIRAVTNQMATMTLVKVLSVSGRMVSIQPIVAQLDGSDNAVPHGTINNVPVWRYQAGGVAVVVDPVVGDIGLAVFAHSDISAAKTNKAASAPGSRRRFDWADAIYLGGLFGNDTPATRITLSANGVDITSDQPVTINATAGTTINGPLTAAQGLTVTGGATIDGKDFATHIHKGVTAGTGVSGVVN